MNGTIICALDDSPETEAAVGVARRLAARFGSRMLLVSVAGADAAAIAGNGGSEEHRVAAGDPAEAVALIAAEEAADLVIVGARAGFFGRLLGRGLARELAAAVSCPVLVVLP